jgi:hypothetical protein
VKSVLQWENYLNSRLRTIINLIACYRTKCEAPLLLIYGRKHERKRYLREDQSRADSGNAVRILKSEAQPNLKSRDINLLGVRVRPGKHLRHRPVLKFQWRTQRRGV